MQHVFNFSVMTEYQSMTLQQDDGETKVLRFEADRPEQKKGMWKEVDKVKASRIRKRMYFAQV